MGMVSQKKPSLRTRSVAKSSIDFRLVGLAVFLCLFGFKAPFCIDDLLGVDFVFVFFLVLLPAVVVVVVVFFAPGTRLAHGDGELVGRFLSCIVAVVVVVNYELSFCSVSFLYSLFSSEDGFFPDWANHLSKMDRFAKKKRCCVAHFRSDSDPIIASFGTFIAPNSN